jgi:hypothetical protein
MSTKLKCSVLKIYSWPVGQKRWGWERGLSSGAKKKEEIAEMLVSSSDNKSVSHWIMFDYFFHV